MAIQGGGQGTTRQLLRYIMEPHGGAHYLGHPYRHATPGAAIDDAAMRRCPAHRLTGTVPLQMVAWLQPLSQVHD